MLVEAPAGCAAGADLGQAGGGTAQTAVRSAANSAGSLVLAISSAYAAGVDDRAGRGMRPVPLAGRQALIACRSLSSLLIWILRGLACSATGMRTVSTPEL
ncbi:MAG: hypothetical protein QOE01_3303 [Actinomycetota bacterium]|nr:hypothetical protein [Actinomycetota bacterium]